MKNTTTSDPQAVLNQITLELLRERKRKQWSRWIRWSILIIFILGIFFAISIDFSSKQKSKSHVGLLNVTGEIADNKEASAENFIKGLTNAYKNPGMKALIIQLNSPGGSPVQADYMYQAIQQHRKAYPNIKVYAVCTDICTSAAYYIAAATDAIYANESSLVGSIGVLYNGFGFVDSLQKLGITRRLITSGDNKGFLDPFSPIQPEQQKLLQTMLTEIHHVFIDRVKAGRGLRLKIDDLTFSGLFWTGIQAQNRGLIDGFSNLRTITRQFVGVQDIIDYSYKQSMIDRLSKQIGAEIANHLPHALGLDTQIRI